MTKSAKPIKRLAKDRKRAALSREISGLWTRWHRAKVAGDGRTAWAMERAMRRLEAERDSI